MLDTAPSRTYEISTELSGASSIKMSSTMAPQFSYTFCTGSFTDIRKVSGYLQWGGQSDCRATTTSVYVHEIYMDLYDTCVGALCVLLDHIYSLRAPQGSYSTVQTALGTNRCESGGGDRTYEQRAKVKVRSVDFGPFWDRDNVVYSCDVEIG